MRGSLAIWYEKTGDSVDGFKPHIELHFNIWRGLPERADALDIGVLFKEIRTISALKIFIPGVVSLSLIEDLSDKLSDSDTLSAVFNEVYSVGPSTVHGFDVLNDRRERVMHVLRVPRDRISLHPIRSGICYEGTVICIDENVLGGGAQHRIGDQYVRIRLNLQNELRNIFWNRSSPRDAIFLPSFSVVDTIEFRVNERRNFSKRLREDYPEMRFPRISALHYFLIVDRHAEIVRSHVNFRKMRLLEPGLWDRYLETLGRVKADDLIIYQWREGGGNEDDVEDFIAFATFRKNLNNINKYILVVLSIGAIGSSISTAWNYGLERLSKALSYDLSTFAISIFSVVTLATLAVALAWLFQSRVDKP